jgi:erythronate-4-phosphate dehydrogenase
MKIVVDENIEFCKEAFEQFGEVSLTHGRKITNELLKDASILIVRSITNVNKELLDGTNVKFVGTATIGTDHLDKEYLDQNKIKYTSAPGCNSYAVTEYVLTTLAYLANLYDFELNQKSIGIIGYGNIGKKLTYSAKAIGMKVLVNDPPLLRENFDYDFAALEDVLQCDIITFHVPMNKKGIDKTFHLLDHEKISVLKPGTIVINTSRGGVVDNKALLDRIQNKNDIISVLDVWESEPLLNQKLLQKVFIGTPHIAGYSYEGKVNGTTMIYDELCNFLNQEKMWKPKLKEIENSKLTIDKSDNFNKFLSDITKQIYDIQKDSNSLKELVNVDTSSLAENFDKLRKNYNLRREFNNYFIPSENLTPNQKDILEKLRFNLA